MIRPKAEDGNEATLSTAQARVVAAKFVGPGIPSGTRPPPALPSTYGESHMLLLARDPQTLFAAWDVSPAAVEGLKTRIGRRGFAVSTLTLRLTPSGGQPAIFHLEKRARSRYLRIAGASSFVAEIGFTTPSGHFELVARSAPCSASTGAKEAREREGTAGRWVVKYGQAAALARQGVALASVARRVGTRPAPAPPDRGSFATLVPAPNSLTSRPATARMPGGASDLYRR